MKNKNIWIKLSKWKKKKEKIYNLTILNKEVTNQVFLKNILNNLNKNIFK